MSTTGHGFHNRILLHYINKVLDISRQCKDADYQLMFSIVRGNEEWYVLSGYSLRWSPFR